MFVTYNPTKQEQRACGNLKLTAIKVGGTYDKMSLIIYRPDGSSFVKHNVKPTFESEEGCYNDIVASIDKPEGEETHS